MSTDNHKPRLCMSGTFVVRCGTGGLYTDVCLICYPASWTEDPKLTARLAIKHVCERTFHGMEAPSQRWETTAVDKRFHYLLHPPCVS